MLTTSTACRSRTTVTNGANWQSLASTRGTERSNGLPASMPSKKTTTSLRPYSPLSSSTRKSWSNLHPCPLDMRPQYSGSGNVTRLNALGVGIVPFNVTTPVIVPPLSTSTTSYASAPGLMMENQSTVAILIANCQKDVLIGIPLDNVFYINRMFKKAFQRGH